MCQNPDGPHEHVPLKPGEDPGACFIGRDCCTPRVYVALDAVLDALLARAEGNHGTHPDAFRMVANLIEREFGADS